MRFLGRFTLAVSFARATTLRICIASSLLFTFACGDDGPSVEETLDGLDGDQDGFARDVGGDCDDDDPSVFPGADEIPYDGIDQDCSGTDLVDVDGDGFASAAAGGADCDDLSASVRPDGVEICGDGIDQDCSGADQSCGDVDRDGDGASPNQGDCNDDDPAISPTAAEVPYSGVDDDCAEATPDDDLDEDGFRLLTGDDCDDEEPGIHPGAEDIAYDGVDQDCSGADLDDIDGDGFASVVAGGADCNDADASVSPGAGEVLGDLIDSDCNGELDEVSGVALATLDSSDGSQRDPHITAGNDRILVTWTDESGANSLIFGRFWGLDGQPLGARFQISEGGQSASFSESAFDGEKFFVVYSLRVGGGANDVYGRLVAPDGGLVTAETAYGETGADDQSTVTFAGSQYLVVWRQDGTHRMFARRVGTDGVPIDAADINFGSTNLHPDQRFATASNGADFLVVWSRLASSGLDVEARMIAADGSVGSFIKVTDRTGTIEQSVRAAFSGHAFLVTFQLGSALYGQFLDSNGVPIYTDVAENFLITNDADTDLRSAGAVAYVPERGEFVVVWTSGGRVFFSRVPASAPTPAPNRLLTAPTETHLAPTVAAANGRAYWLTEADLGDATGRNIAGGTLPR
jgi:hypothetical protein